MKRAGGAARFVGGAVASFLLMAASSRTQPPAATSSPRPDIRSEVQLAGCQLLREGGLCEFDPSEPLTLWVRGGEQHLIRVTTELGATPIVESALVAGGLRIRTRPPRSARSLQVWSGWHALRKLALREHVPFHWEREANRLRRSGRVDEAKRLVQPRTASTSNEESSRARAMLARLALQDGSYSEAASGLTRTSEEAQRFGRVSDVMSDLLALSFVQLENAHDLVAARKALDVARQVATNDDVGRADWLFYSGLLAARLGDLWSARSHYRQAAEAASRLALGPSQRAANVELAKLDVELGRTSEALSAIRQAWRDNQREPDCVLGPLTTNLAWMELLALEQGHAAPDVDAHLELAQRLNDECRSVRLKRVDRINLGLRAVQRADARLAREAWGSALALPGRPIAELELWEQELKGRVQLLEGDAHAAIETFERQAVLARALDDWNGRQRAALGLGNALEQTGRTSEALRAYQRAVDVLSRTNSRLPLGTARDGFSKVHDRAALQLVDALLRLGQRKPAFDVALRMYQQSFFAAAAAARARRHRSSQALDKSMGAYLELRARIDLEAARDWELSAERLEALTHERAARVEAALENLYDENERLEAPGSAAARDLPAEPKVISFLVIPNASEWRFFGHSSGGLRVGATLDTSSNNRASWLDEFAVDLEHVERLTFLPYAAAHDVDWAWQTWNGAPLLRRFDVAYGLGLPPADRGAGRVTTALTVADPTWDLPAARGDAIAVSTRVNVPHHELLAGADARRERVMEALARADLFYYAGHGQATGLLGGAGLPLADGSPLTPDDVLTLSRVPRFVVLAACDAASSEGETLSAGWSLAHAFLMAGSEQVVAPSKPIGDIEAARLTGPMMEAFDPEHPDLVSALSSALRAPHPPGATARAFRALVR